MKENLISLAKTAGLTSDKVDADVAKLTAFLLQPPKPHWTRLDTPVLHKSTYQAICQIISPKELPTITQLPLSIQYLL